MQHFYFDHNATTPVAPEVLETVVSCLGQVYGNASSIHHFGQGAKQRLEAARRQLASLIHANPAEMVFTSGGTEADNMAVLGVVRAPRGGPRHVITTAIEHPAVLGPCAQLEREGVAVTRLRVGAGGMVNPDDVRRALRPETVLVSVMHANNELGTIQPIAEIARIAREAGVPLHVDGVQALGKIPVDVEALGVDLYSMSGAQALRAQGRGRALRPQGNAGSRRSPSAAITSATAVPAPRTFPASRPSAPRPSWRRATWRPMPSASPRCATAWKTPCSTASRAPASTARAGAARPTPATCTSTASMARRW